MAKTTLRLALYAKIIIWDEIFERNALLQKQLAELHDEYSTDSDWNSFNKRFMEERESLLKGIYGFERPSPFPIVETTAIRPEILFRSDGTACGMRHHDPPTVRTLMVDLRYTREELMHQFKAWLDATWENHNEVRLPEKQQVAKWE